jgi:glucose/arabinose dehydrogenase
MHRFTFAFASLWIFPAWLAAAASDVQPLLPDQSERKERSGFGGRRFIAPEGFEVEEVAGNDLVGSIVNMTFDHLGRPALARENGGILILLDEDKDGKFESFKTFTDQIKTAHGMHFIAPGDLLVTCNGPQGAGLYRLTDADGDDSADKIEFLAGTRIGGIGEHGPHAILTGYDGFIYVLYGNHSYPDVSIDPDSPSRHLEEDQLIERYVDPRGHATNIRAPGGTILRLDLERNSWSQFCGGFRNAFDFAIDEMGEFFTFDSDM